MFLGACEVDLCTLEDNCFCEQPFGSIVDSGEPGNESTRVKVIPSHSLSQIRPDLSSNNLSVIRAERVLPFQRIHTVFSYARIKVKVQRSN